MGRSSFFGKKGSNVTTKVRNAVVAKKKKTNSFPAHHNINNLESEFMSVI